MQFMEDDMRSLHTLCIYGIRIYITADFIRLSLEHFLICSGIFNNLAQTWQMQYNARSQSICISYQMGSVEALYVTQRLTTQRNIKHHRQVCCKPCVPPGHTIAGAKRLLANCSRNSPFRCISETVSSKNLFLRQLLFCSQT